MASKIRLITFDAFNTFFKPKGGVSAQYVEEASKHGIQITKEQISQHFEPAYKKQITKAPLYGVRQGMTPKQWWKELVYTTFINAGVSSKDIEPHFNKLFDSLYYRFTTTDGYSIFPEVPSTLEELKRRGFKMGVISNSDERVITVMENLKLSQYFDFILTSSIAKYEKPDKHIFEQALTMAGSVNPKYALHIGDDLNIDYFGSLNAGLNAVLLERGDPISDELPSQTTTSTQHLKRISSLNDLYPFVFNHENTVGEKVNQ